ncbi:NAD-dependent epimerase/dehydratase family protein [Gorillibacterium sp. sgz500922]|uniref:NAD-dependent epimerase/dehydratase family protein n=1 Tax=Gorillibacterium sp. sgz500922 TaxID=3446694 RepID=UPI003F671840
MSSSENGHTALLLGASGLTGSALLRLLAAEPDCRQVTALVRRPLSIAHPKLRVRLVDFDRLADERAEFAADWIFCCLGTTIRKAGSQETFARVDRDYPLAAGRLAAEGGARSLHVISSVGATPASRVFYTRTKGQLEDGLSALPLRQLHIYHPSLLLGDREEFRLGERAAAVAMRAVDGLLRRGALARYRAIPAGDVAAAMLAAALELDAEAAPKPGSPALHEGAELFRLARRYEARSRAREEARP